MNSLSPPPPPPPPMSSSQISRFSSHPSPTLLSDQHSDHQDRLRLQTALSQISRLEREFQAFRTRAGAQLSAALEENRQLKHRLDSQRQHPLQEKENNPPHLQTLKHFNPVKPTERMLSVDEMRRREVMRKSLVRRSLKPVRGNTANPTNVQNGLTNDKTSASVRGMGRAGFDGERKELDGLGGPPSTRASKPARSPSGAGSAGERTGRRGSLLPRSFSRKWSGCF